MNLYEISIMSLLDLLGYFIISNKLISGTHNNARKNHFKIGGFLIFLSIIMGIIGKTSFKKYSFIAGGIVALIFIYISHGRNLKETIIIYVLSTIVLLTIQFLVLAILSIFNNKDIFDFNYGIVAQCIILSILFIICKYIPLNVLFQYSFKKNNIFNYIVINVFTVLLVLLIYRYIEMEGILKNILIISILSIEFIFVNLVLIRNGLRNEYDEKMLATYEKYLPVIDGLMNEIRAKQHEFDNHIQLLHMLTTVGGDCEKINYSIKDYIKDIDLNTDTRSLLKLDNKILAGFLFSKIKKSREKNIEFYINIEDYGFKTCLKDYELIEIIGNLIDNGFETGVENNIVILTLKKEGDMNVIEIKNKHPYLKNDLIKYMFTPGYSTKSSSKRGYGLSNVKNILGKNNGNITVSNESIDGENYVVFKILIP